MRVGVISFPGTLDNRDVERALKLAELEPVEIWHTETSLEHVDAVIIPGGRSYGDYLRPGALATTTPVVKALADKAASGMPILGIGNGFQVLLEAGLLPGALADNASGTFHRADSLVSVVDGNTPWTKAFSGAEKIVLPLRSKVSSFTATPETLEQIENDKLVVLRYADPQPGHSNIAGIKNADGNVVGVMLHPEFAVEAGFGPDTDERMRSGVSGLKFFTSLVTA